MKFKAFCIVLGICCVIGGVWGLSSLYSDYSGQCFLAIFLGIFFIYGGYKFDPAARDALFNAKEYEESLGIRFDKSNNTLYLKHRNPVLRHLIVIQKHAVNSYNYIKPTYTYTSATVGGITTGGISKSGDTFKKNTSYKNYELFYMGTNADKIKEIVLSDELLEQAKKSVVAQYLNFRTIQVVEKVQLSDAFMAASRAGMIDLSVSIMEQEEAAGYPSQEKCIHIVEWLADGSNEPKINDESKNTSSDTSPVSNVESKQVSSDISSVTKNTSKNYKICPACKEMNSLKETVCHRCGWDLSKEYNKSYKICPACKEMNSLKETVCHKCGKRL